MAFERIDGHTAAQVDAVLSVEPGADGPHLRSEHARQRRWLRLDDHDVESEAPSGGRNFQSNESGSDHRNAGVGLKCRANGQGIVERSQDVNARKLVRYRTEPARHCASRDDQAAELERVGVVERDRSLR
jgi:hypothetical protein